MAKSNSIAFMGVPFSACEKFGPRTLAAMFGPVLPKPLHPDRSGAVPVAQTVRYLEQQHAKALAAFADDEIVTPGTPAALAEFS